MERSNPWWRREVDPRLEEWTSLSVNWIPQEMQKLSLSPFSLNFLSGPRQVGKTTMLKLLIRELLEVQKKDPRQILYFPCDELSDFKELGETLDSYLSAKASWRLKQSYIFLDEVTFVDDWWRALKSRIDAGRLSNDVITVTGSASLDLLKQREHFPGRRGNEVDIIMRPLSFRFYARALKHVETQPTQENKEHGESFALQNLPQTMDANRIHGDSLRALFNDYLETGGFPLAIREKVDTGKVLDNSKKALLDGLRGDWLRVSRSERTMKEVIGYILSARGTPISWLSVAKSTSIGSPNTARKYIETLGDLLLTFELELLRPDFKVVYRKNKKIHFTDPFIYSVLSRYTGVELDQAAVVEATIASHLSRKYETYYWRNHSEVDVIALDRGMRRQYGYEVKWGFKKGIKPRHITEYLSLGKETIPIFLASLPF